MKGPRNSPFFMGQAGPPHMGMNGTWCESEDMCGVGGAKIRRCRARNVETGKLQIVRCGIPDTFFSVPCRGGGFVTIEDGEFRYHPPGVRA